MMLGFPIINFWDLHIAKAEQQYPPEVNQDINISYVHNIAQQLSNVIYTYSPSELAKGRAFGSNGERYAAQNILAHEMSHIGLYNLSLSPPYLERINNTPKEKNNTCELEVNAKSMTITNITNASCNNKSVDCFISPRWSLEGNWTSGVKAPKHNRSLLTHDFNYTDLKIYRSPREFFHYIIELFNHKLNTLMEHFNESNITGFEDYVISQFQNYYNFTFEDIIDHPENATRLPWYNATLYGPDDYLLMEEDRGNNPNYSRVPVILGLVTWINNRLHNMGLPWYIHQNEDTLTLDTAVLYIRTIINRMLIRLYRHLPHCKGVIRYDYSNDSHDELPNENLLLPILYINGSIGKKIEQDRTHYRVNFSINQKWNSSEISYNVIGQITGKDPTKTIIINSLYDCMFNSGTADSSIGCGIVLALARKYKELNDSGIRPKETLRFILFGGEEYGLRGAYWYEHNHSNESITIDIDLNQLGFSQSSPKLTLNLGTNRWLRTSLLEQLGRDTNYVTRINDKANCRVLFRPFGILSNDLVFALNRRFQTDTITFLKDTTWFLHHRDGVNHTQGDVMDYYNSTDVSATASLIFNCTKYFCIDPNCSFAGPITYTTKDSPNDNDNLIDTVEADMPLKSILHSDLVRVKAVLYTHPWYRPIEIAEKDYIINTSATHHSIDITLPPYLKKGFYHLTHIPHIVL